MRDEGNTARYRCRATSEEDRRRIFDFLESLRGHHEETQLASRAKTIFHGPDDAKPAAEITLKIQYRIHHVLKDSGAGQRTFLRHMAHEYGDDGATFREVHELGRTLTKLADGARRRLQLLTE